MAWDRGLFFRASSILIISPSVEARWQRPAVIFRQADEFFCRTFRVQ